ncbi:MAG: NAD(P)H-binding protein [Candidatus Sulfotelmatobacter sp.]
MGETVVITGAFSYTGKYATRLLLDNGYRVRTLTSHPERANPFGELVAVFPYNFERPDELRSSFAGVSTLINTYWVRFPRGGVNFETAVRNSRILIAAAHEAGVRRIVHVSIANPSLESPLAYYRGKAEVERIVRESGMSYAMVRPTVIFGGEDILINNIGWFVRHLPVFGIPGGGRYGIRPIYVEDMARVLVASVAEVGNSVRDAVGPETFRFEELVRMIARELGRRTRIVHVPTVIAYLSTLVTGWLVRDVVLTWEEYGGLISNLLAPEGPATGSTRLSEWLAESRESMGRRYASEVERHF